MKKFGAFLVYLLAFAVLLAVAAMFVGFRISSSETNLRNVFVGDVHVGGLTRDETEKTLVDRGWQARAETPLVVTTLRGESFSVDPVRSGVVSTVDQVVDRAYAIGHDGDMVSNLITAVRVFLDPVDVNRGERVIDTAYLDGLIDDCIARLQAGMGDEAYTVDPYAAEMTMVKGWNQISFDKADFRSAVIAALEAGQTEMSYKKLASEISSPDFEAIHTELWKEPADAFYTDDGTFTVVDEIVGCRFDVRQAQEIWDAAAPGDEVRIPLDIDWPAVTGEQLRNQLFHDLLGACMTKFPNSGENRRSNLQLCASRINEFVLYPGETFSYNTIVGQRTEEAGFLPAPAYVDGDVKDEIGGGACQISSTLYAATAFAFLETVDRTCHVFPVNYMQMGTDATVTIPAEGKSIDFKFRNNKSFPIKILTYFNNEESTISVEIWGTLEEYDYMPVEFDNTYSWQYDYDRVIDPAYPDRAGYTIKFQTEIYSFEDDFSAGYRTLTHRLVIDAEGNIIEDQIINMKRDNDQYAMDTYYQHP